MGENLVSQNELEGCHAGSQDLSPCMREGSAWKNTSEY